MEEDNDGFDVKLSPVTVREQREARARKLLGLNNKADRGDRADQAAAEDHRTTDVAKVFQQFRSEDDSVIRHCNVCTSSGTIARRSVCRASFAQLVSLQKLVTSYLRWSRHVRSVVRGKGKGRQINSYIQLHEASTRNYNLSCCSTTQGWSLASAVHTGYRLRISLIVAFGGPLASRPHPKQLGIYLIA